MTKHGTLEEAVRTLIERANCLNASASSCCIEWLARDIVKMVLEEQIIPLEEELDKLDDEIRILKNKLYELENK